MPDASLKVTLSGSDQLSGPAASAASAVQAVKTAATGAAPAVNLLGQQGGSALVGLSADARAAQAAIRGAAADMESLNQRGQKGTQRGAELAPNLPLRQVLPDNWQQGTTAGSESLRAFTQRLGEVEGASDSARGKLASLGGQGLNLKGILGEVGRSAAGALGHLATGAAMAGLESVKAMWRDIGAATDEANAAAEKVGATYAKTSAWGVFKQTWLGGKDEDSLSIKAPTKEDKVAQDNAAYALQLARQKAQVSDRERAENAAAAADQARIVADFQAAEQRGQDAATSQRNEQVANAKVMLALVQQELDLRRQLGQAQVAELQTVKEVAAAERSRASAVTQLARDAAAKLLADRSQAVQVKLQIDQSELDKLKAAQAKTDETAKLSTPERRRAAREEERTQRATARREREIDRLAGEGERAQQQGRGTSADQRIAQQIVRNRRATQAGERRVAADQGQALFADLDQATAAAEAVRRREAATRQEQEQAVASAQAKRAAAKGATADALAAARQGTWPTQGTGQLIDQARASQSFIARRENDRPGQQQAAIQQAQTVIDFKAMQTTWSQVLTELQAIRARTE